MSRLRAGELFVPAPRRRQTVTAPPWAGNVPLGIPRQHNASVTYRFLKGHGTENDFVILPDPLGTEHVDLSAAQVRALCDRHGGLGADGVLRAVRVGTGRWFMDYRNADGSISEMCGNGIRVFARYLHDHEGVEFPIEVETRDGIKVVQRDGEEYTVDMGRPVLGGTTEIEVDGVRHAARVVSMGNPHAVTFVDDLAQAGSLLDPPWHDTDVYPDGVNVEFVARVGERHIAMRVHERGSGETRSCGTGACAATVAAAAADDAPAGCTYTVDVPGGRLRVEWTAEDRVLLSGPAQIVAEGLTEL